MATSLATVRTNLLTALASITTTQKYRRRQTNPQFPCHVIGWPDELDIHPDFGDERTMTIPVWVGVDVADDDSADDLLSSLLESTVTALEASSVAYKVNPVTQFGEQVLDDDRVVVWCAIPVSVLA